MQLTESWHLISLWPVIQQRVGNLPSKQVYIMLKPRLLLIEDNLLRIETFTEWLSGSEFVLVICRSGGQAKGMMTMGGAETIAGILLDHDLTESAITEHDRSLSSTDLLPLIATVMKKWTPVLIHSHNPSKAARMHQVFESAGMSVTQTRFASLSRDSFDEWLQEVRDNLV